MVLVRVALHRILALDVDSLEAAGDRGVEHVYSQPALPYDLSQLGFASSLLYPQPDILGFYQAGTTWPTAGYVAHNFPQTLVAATTPGAMTAYLQRVVFGVGPAWNGGVSEAMQIRVQ